MTKRLPRVRSLRAFIALLLPTAILTFSASSPALANWYTTSTIVGPTGSDSFGSTGSINNVTVLANGNLVIVDSDFDSSTASNVGAVHVYDGTTLERLSSITGSSTNDYVGLGWVPTNTPGIVVLQGSSNFLIVSTGWDSFDNGLRLTDTGAVTWVNGSTGLPANTTQNTDRTYQVSASNSLVGGVRLSGERLGSGGVVSLTNGNYVVSTPETNLTADNAGYVTWCSGSSPCTGVINASNSLHGSSILDEVGSSGVTALTNGNYVVRSPKWNGTVADVGAVTWCNGATGCTGPVNASNSLVGSTATDSVGSSGVTALTNGNYLVRSSLWDNGGEQDASAVTWCDGSTAGTRCVGAVSSSNSLVGSKQNDNVGGSGIAELSNGNYVVRSGQWDNGATTNVGAATWCNGSTGCVGTIDSNNSLIGSKEDDQVATNGVTALTNGNYVVRSEFWDNGATIDVGAATWCGGTSATRCVGTIDSNNSLIGSKQDDQIGNKGITALSNDNYIVSSPNWDNGATTNVGAATWCGGTSATRCVGAVATSNSLYGPAANDQVGFMSTTALTSGANGFYVVRSPYWGTYRGAVTWCGNTNGCTGPVTTSNSLHGTQTGSSSSGDQVGLSNLVAIADGNYVVASSGWDLSASVTNVGAITWCSGSVGCIGPVDTNNSLHGSSTNDKVGDKTGAALTAGSQRNNIIFPSPEWDNVSPAQSNVGAISLFNTSTSGPRTTGPVTSTNSVLGTVTNQYLGNAVLPRFDPINDRVVVYNFILSPNDTNTVLVIAMSSSSSSSSGTGSGSGSGSPPPTTVTSPTASTAPAITSGALSRSTVTIAEFADNSPRLTAELRRQVRSVVNRYPGLIAVDCRGFVRTSRPANTRQLELANSRARNVCALFKKLKPNVETTISRGAATDNRRRVRLTLTK